MPRPRCDQTDFTQYLAVWPLLSFSIFTATDSIVNMDNTESATVAVPLLLLKNLVHVFALSTILLTIVELYVAYAHKNRYLCTRRVFLEMDTLASGVFLVILTLVNCFQPLARKGVHLNDTGIFVCRIVPWTIAAIVLTSQIFYIVRNESLLSTPTKQQPPPVIRAVIAPPRV